MSQNILRVSQLVSKLKGFIETKDEFQHFQCIGEISNLTKSKAGHWYFSLKDEVSKINAVMWSSLASKLATPIAEGDEVLIKGSLSVYSASGQVQIVVSTMALYGQGALYQKYLKLRDSLHKKGYFNQQYKQPIPTFPSQIGIIVGANSAAQADILKTLSSRWPIAKVKMYESLVQGAAAPAQLIEQLKMADKDGNDVIILARGGGSLEDLWAFNDLDLVMTIFKIKTPLITGVGHEIDTTLVDYVADQRGLTPTDAAMIATPELSTVLQNVEQMSQQLINRQRIKLNQAQSNFDSLFLKSKLSRSELILFDAQSDLKELSNQLDNFLVRFQSIVINFEKRQTELFTQTKAITLKTSNRLDLMNQKFINTIKSKLYDKKQTIKMLSTQLDLKSPLTILSKGYLLSYQNQKLVKSTTEIKSNLPLVLKYIDGEVVVSIEKGANHARD